jgi:hypothetical protein
MTLVGFDDGDRPRPSHASQVCVLSHATLKRISIGVDDFHSAIAQVLWERIAYPSANTTCRTPVRRGVVFKPLASWNVVVEIAVRSV